MGGAAAGSAAGAGAPSAGSRRDALIRVSEADSVFAGVVPAEGVPVTAVAASPEEHSPASPTRAITSPIASVSPSWATISVSVPAVSAS